MLIDTHCHLHDQEFFSGRQAEKMLVAARERGVEKIIVVGTDPADSLAAQKFAAAHDGVYWAYGAHPSEAQKGERAQSVSSSVTRREESEDAFEGHPQDGEDEATNPVTTGVRSVPKKRFCSSRVALRLYSSETDCTLPPIAIGEIGLDYHYEPYDRTAQMRLFEEQLQLAQDQKLPVIFHIREAFDDFFPVVANFPQITGVVHSFSDNKKNLRKILEGTDFYVGVNGLATYSTLPTPPLERILLETDAPFLAPVPHRGETNQPAFIPDIAEWLAGKLGTNIEKVATETSKNAESLFALDAPRSLC